MERFDLKKDRDRAAEYHPNEELIQQTEADLLKASTEFAEQYPETVMWMHEELRRINMGGLQSAFKNIIESVHGTFDRERVLAPERTYILDTPHNQAYHLIGMRINVLNGTYFLPEKNTLPEQWKIAHLLTLICHENVHSTGRIHWSPDSHSSLFGYEKKMGTKAMGQLFNEGMTELITEKIVREYLIGFPMRTRDRENPILNVEAYDNFRQNVYEKKKYIPQEYDVATEFVRSLSMHIDTKFSLKPGSAENILVAGYFRGVEEFDPNFLDTLVGDGFTVALKYSKTIDDFRNIIREFSLPAVTPTTERRVEKALKELAKQQ